MHHLIISASRRTDIPAFYGEWFFNRLSNGEIAVRNPMNDKQVTHFKFNPRDIECIVFWTKNPKDFIKYLDKIDSLGYKYYFQFTITPYNNDIEPNSNKQDIITTFIELSEKIGKEKVIWRYDPIFFNDKYPVDFHIEMFEKIMRSLHAHTEKCVISFVDKYHFLINDFKNNDINELTAMQIEDFILRLKEVLNRHSPELAIATCGEKIDLGKYGIQHNKCIDDELISGITGVRGTNKKDPSQRTECGCVQSRDIGTYNTCLHHCIYCYAKRGKKMDAALYNKDSLLLCDTIDAANDKIKVIDLRDEQGMMF
ncbi:hypothetical protein AGMMS49940_19930 [Spirochaetia bacterium]|nr:hypothetical protein AGMMS49940_19930 [Spirochaetia bacterium]